jgi:hypothetical protein
MNIQSIIIAGVPYKLVNDTTYYNDTPDEVIKILETYRQKRGYENNTRLVLDYGNTETGKSWREIYNITGYIGKTGGKMKMPILLYSSRSLGGGLICTNKIVRILTAKGKQILYSHKNYHI